MSVKNRYFLGDESSIPLVLDKIQGDATSQPKQQGGKTIVKIPFEFKGDIGNVLKTSFTELTQEEALQKVQESQILERAKFTKK